MLQRVLEHLDLGGENQQAQSDNLGSIILEGAHFGVVLFSQPSVWVFGWETKRSTTAQAGQRSLVLFPSVSEVIIKSGKQSLRTVVDAVKEEI